MNKELTSFFTKLGIFSAITFVIIYFLQQSIYFKSSLYWLVWLFFIFSTVVIHVLLTKAQQSPQKFIRTFMGLTALKLFAYLLILVVYALLRKQSAMPFIFCFLLMYFLYTPFEVIMLFKQLKKK